MRIEGMMWKDKVWVSRPCKADNLPPRSKKNKVSGIYCIEVSDVKMVYIGQSINIQSRWSQWRHVLKKGKCEIKEMQSFWDMNKGFVFTVLEETETDMLEKEKAYAEDFVRRGYELFNTYFLVNAQNMLLNEDDKKLVQKLLKLITKGRINRNEFEQYLDNL